jgi:hypothetical protein
MISLTVCKKDEKECEYEKSDVIDDAYDFGRCPLFLQHDGENVLSSLLPVQSLSGEQFAVL